MQSECTFISSQKLVFVERVCLIIITFRHEMFWFHPITTSNFLAECHKMCSGILSTLRFTSRTYSISRIPNTFSNLRCSETPMDLKNFQYVPHIRQYNRNFWENDIFREALSQQNNTPTRNVLILSKNNQSVELFNLIQMLMMFCHTYASM